MPQFEHSKDCITTKAQELIEQRKRSEVITIQRLWEIIETVASSEVTNCPSEDEIDLSCYFCGGEEVSGE